MESFMAKNTIKHLRGLSFISAILISSAVAHAENSATETVSSLCSPADISELTCDSASECAVKTQNAIRTFAEKYDVPAASSFTPLEYPKWCYPYGTDKVHTVNLSYNVLPNGRSEGAQILNSSNDCFNRAAVKHIKKIRFEKTASGYSCVPASLTFKATHVDTFAPSKYTTYLGPASRASDEVRP